MEYGIEGLVLILGLGSLFGLVLIIFEGMATLVQNICKIIKNPSILTQRVADIVSTIFQGTTTKRRKKAINYAYNPTAIRTTKVSLKSQKISKRYVA